MTGNKNAQLTYNGTVFAYVATYKILQKITWFSVRQMCDKLITVFI